MNRNGISAMKTVFSPRGLGGEYVKCPQLSTQGGGGQNWSALLLNDPSMNQISYKN